MSVETKTQFQVRAAPRKRANKARKGMNRGGRKDCWLSIIDRPPIFPQSVRRKLVYYDYNQSLATTTGLPTTRFFSANGCYDPDFSGTGHQPMGFDQMMLFYDQYTVLASKITVTFTADASAMRFGLGISPDTTALGTALQIVENGMLTSRTCDASNGGTGPRIFPLTNSVDCARYFGRDPGRALVNDPELHGTATANPVEGVYYACSAWNFMTTVTCTAYYDVLIEYDVVFTEPRKVANS